MSRIRPVLRTLLLLPWVAPALLTAHDFWLAPSDHRPGVGDRVALRLLVGERLAGEPLARRSDHIVRFTAHHPAGSREVPGVEGGDPAGLLPVDREGTWVIEYLSRPSTVELDSATFARYLEEEGLEERAAGWVDLPGAGPVREAFTRCAKTILDAGGSGGGFDRVVGLPLELVPEADPAGGGRDGLLPVRLLWLGEPLPGVRVTAIPAAAPGEAQAAVTDGEGRVTFRLDRSGSWLLKAIQLEPAGPDGGLDWRSWWASLTFVAAAR